MKPIKLSHMDVDVLKGLNPRMLQWSRSAFSFTKAPLVDKALRRLCRYGFVLRVKDPPMPDLYCLSHTGIRLVQELHLNPSLTEVTREGQPLKAHRMHLPSLNMYSLEGVEFLRCSYCGCDLTEHNEMSETTMCMSCYENR